MKQEVLIAGFGGQGILLMGRLIAEAAMTDGLYATWFPSYGPEMRGGTANCTTVFSDEEIGSPIAAEYDTVIAMNQPSLERFAPQVRAGGSLIVNSSMVPVRSLRTDIRVFEVPALDLARKVGGERVANVVMLGAFLAISPAPQARAYEQAITSVVGMKHAEMVEANLAALRAGTELIAGGGNGPRCRISDAFVATGDQIVSV